MDPSVRSSVSVFAVCNDDTDWARLAAAYTDARRATSPLLTNATSCDPDPEAARGFLNSREFDMLECCDSSMVISLGGRFGSRKSKKVDRPEVLLLLASPDSRSRRGSPREARPP
ncbi:hypothetical protein EW146_g1230 [Bondarzewia mesenterica]|uniref:Uncharacterized protein n=1 Tax=Bondarzewia mesenterica TaxID=1095465 RepID=A0A4V3XG50_9AGAM|nr:hypothetical protein EW146_g1230 [Bondarzewia mesenterica]